HTTTGKGRVVGGLLAMLLVAGECGDDRGDLVPSPDAGVAEAVESDLVAATVAVAETTVTTTAPTAPSVTVAVTTTVAPFPDIDEELSEFDDLESLLDEIDDLLGDSLEGEDS
ncbi:MAG: hypothetical protein HZA58_01060, partial [Acidimicrobiia bacterium]|nr:hypothetical protein [Acidimicrobiia bacterium]